MGAKVNNPIHGFPKRAIYEQSWLTEAFTFLAGLAGLGLSAFKFWQEGGFGSSVYILTVLLVLTLILGAFKVAAAFKKDQKEDLAKGHEGIVGALHIMLALVSNVGNVETSKLRTTFHRVVPSGEQLQDAEEIEQIVGYVGRTSDSKNKLGRTFKTRSGITGMAIRLGEPVTFERTSDNFEEYVRELVRDWNYLQKDASNMNKDTFSAIAIPVSSKDGAVIGVLYMDSTQRGTFSSEEVQAVLLEAVNGFSNYVGDHYE